MTLALGSEHMTVWWVTLGVGLVVILVAISLLEMLYGLVRTIDVGVLQVWEMGKRVAANTATTWQFNQTAQLVEELGRELGAEDYSAGYGYGNGGNGSRVGNGGNGGFQAQDTSGSGGERPRRSQVPRSYLT